MGTSSEDITLNSTTGTSSALAREDHTHAGLHSITTLPDGVGVLGPINVSGKVELLPKI